MVPRVENLRRIAALVVAATFFVAATAGAVEIEGVAFPDRRQLSGTLLRLIGVGLLRYRVIFRGYVAALYLGEQVTPERALEDVPRRLEIEYFWSIPAKGFAEATIRGITRNVDAETRLRLRSRIDEINALYEDVGPGDRYSLTYVPGNGTELALNGEARGVIEGADFSSALFSIWLGSDPLDPKLRDQLLAER